MRKNMQLRVRLVCGGVDAINRREGDGSGGI